MVAAVLRRLCGTWGTPGPRNLTATTGRPRSPSLTPRRGRKCPSSWIFTVTIILSSRIEIRRNVLKAWAARATRTGSATSCQSASSWLLMATRGAGQRRQLLNNLLCSSHDVQLKGICTSKRVKRTTSSSSSTWSRRLPPRCPPRTWTMSTLQVWVKDTTCVISMWTFAGTSNGAAMVYELLINTDIDRPFQRWHLQIR